MKKLSIIFILLTIANITFAQSAKYTSMMEKTITELNNTRDVESLQKVANTFERIAGAETKEWLPNYYVSYTYMNLAMAHMQKGATEKMVASVEKAQVFLDKAKAINAEDSEIYTLQGYIYQGRIWEDPMTNGAKYSPMCYAELGKAIAINPENPRPYFIKGQNLFYTPEFFGGGADNAKPSLLTAKEKFASFKPESSIYPTWGSQGNDYLLNKIEPKAEPEEKGK